MILDHISGRRNLRGAGGGGSGGHHMILDNISGRRNSRGAGGSGGRSRPSLTSTPESLLLLPVELRGDGLSSRMIVCEGGFLLKAFVPPNMAALPCTPRFTSISFTSGLGGGDLWSNAASATGRNFMPFNLFVSIFTIWKPCALAFDAGVGGS